MPQHLVSVNHDDAYVSLDDRWVSIVLVERDPDMVCPTDIRKFSIDLVTLQAIMEALNGRNPHTKKDALEFPRSIRERILEVNA